MSGGTRSIAGRETEATGPSRVGSERKPTAALPMLRGVSTERSGAEGSQGDVKSALIATLREIASVTVDTDCPVNDLAGRFAYALGTTKGLAEIALLRAGARYECPSCDQQFSHHPFVSEDESADEAKRRGRTWCSKECLEKYAERCALDRAADQVEG